MTPDKLIFILLAIAGAYLVFFVLTLQRKGLDIKGSSPIHPIGYKTGKSAMFLTWGFLAFRTGFGETAMFQSSLIIHWIAVCILFLGVVVAILSLHQLGEQTKMGLPEGDTLLKTTAIYSISRNPMYVSLFLIALASAFYYPHPVNLLAGITGVFIHHKIILAEEKFLEKRFGKKWENYRNRVGRYL